MLRLLLSLPGDLALLTLHRSCAAIGHWRSLLLGATVDLLDAHRVAGEGHRFSERAKVYVRRLRSWLEHSKAWLETDFSPLLDHIFTVFVGKVMSLSCCLVCWGSTQDCKSLRALCEHTPFGPGALLVGFLCVTMGSGTRIRPGVFVDTCDRSSSFSVPEDMPTSFNSPHWLWRS